LKAVSSWTSSDLPLLPNGQIHRELRALSHGTLHGEPAVNDQ
jgi:hypothetical protein